MILKIGIRQRKAFTLLEVMVTVAVLSLGAVLIYEAFFISLDSFNYCSNYLNLSVWMNEKLWETEDSLNRSISLGQLGTSGELEKKGKKFNWNLSLSPINKEQGLYQIDLKVFWQEGQREVKILKSTYALYKKEE